MFPVYTIIVFVYIATDSLSEKARMADNKRLEAIQAAAENDLDTLKRLRREGIDLSEGDYDYRTPLHLACDEGHPEIIRFLLNECSVDTTKKDRWKKTAYDVAKSHGNQDVISVFRPKIWEANDAAARGHLEGMKRMHKAGYNFNCGDYDDRTPLHLAASNGHVDLVNFLVNEAKVDVNVKDRWGKTALDSATDNSKDQIIPLLKEKTKKSLSILDAIEAASNGNLSALKRFNDVGANLSKGDYDKRTPLHLACAEGQVEVVKYLVEELKVDTKCKDRWGNTAMDEAERAKGGDDTRKLIIEILEGNRTGSFHKSSDFSPASSTKK